MGAKVEEARRVARDALFRQVVRIHAPLRAKADAPFPEGQRYAIRGPEPGMVTGRTGNVPVAGQDGIVEQELPEGCAVRIDGPIVRVGDRGG